jgi:hypothetical protein
VIYIVVKLGKQSLEDDTITLIIQEVKKSSNLLNYLKTEIPKDKSINERGFDVNGVLGALAGFLSNLRIGGVKDINNLMKLPIFIDINDIITTKLNPTIPLTENNIEAYITGLETLAENKLTISIPSHPLKDIQPPINISLSILPIVQGLLRQLNTRLSVISEEAELEAKLEEHGTKHTSDEPEKSEDALLGELKEVISTVIPKLEEVTDYTPAAANPPPPRGADTPSSLSTKEINQIISDMIALVNQGMNPMMALLKSVNKKGITDEELTKLIQMYVTRSKTFDSFNEGLGYYDKDNNTVTTTFKGLTPKEQEEFVIRYAEEAKKFLEALQKQQKGGSKVQQGIRSLKQLRKKISHRK